MKTPIKRNIFILDDGKKGHLNQSQAVAQLIPEAHIHIVPICYRTWPGRVLMNILCHAAWSTKLRKTYLKLCLKNFPLDFFLPHDKKIIISAGAATEPVNYLLSTQETINIVVLKPLRYKKFDLIIPPQHDNPLKRKNVFSTTLALSSLNPSHTERCALELRRKLQLGSTQCASVFVGGNSRHFSMGFSHLEHILKELAQSPLITLITISRRTPPAVIEHIKNWQKIHKEKTYLVLEEGENTVSGMLGLGTYIFITEDSVSMISEALNCHKKPFIIHVKKIRESKKILNFKKMLRERKLIIDSRDFKQFKNDFLFLNLKDNPFEGEKDKIKERLLEIL